MFQELEKITLLKPEQFFFHFIRQGILVDESLIFSDKVFAFYLLYGKGLGVTALVAFAFTTILNDGLSISELHQEMPSGFDGMSQKITSDSPIEDLKIFAVNSFIEPTQALEESPVIHSQGHDRVKGLLPTWCI